MLYLHGGAYGLFPHREWHQMPTTPPSERLCNRFLPLHTRNGHITFHSRWSLYHPQKNSTLNSYSEGLSVAFQQSLCAQFIVLISFFTSLLTFHLVDSTHLIVGWLFFGGEAVHKPQHKNPFLYVINSTEMGKSNWESCICINVCDLWFLQ